MNIISKDLAESMPTFNSDKEFEEHNKKELKDGDEYYNEKLGVVRMYIDGYWQIVASVL